mgnify:CR=1 FL=1
MCKDVTISNNVFDYCGEAGILIKPEKSFDEATVAVPLSRSVAELINAILSPL